MRKTTLGVLKQKSRQRADMENSQFISDSELVGLINDSITELYDILITTFEDYYLKDEIISVVHGQDEYALPDDFYKLAGVDLRITDSEFLTLKPFQFTERNTYNNSVIYASSQDANVRSRYRLIGDVIKFIPAPSAGKDIKLWYHPSFVDLVDDADEFNGINGYEELVILDVAMKMLQKEESDTTALERRYARTWERVTSTAHNRDAGESMRVGDVGGRTLNYYGMV